MKDFLTEGERKSWNIKLYQFKDPSTYRDTFWEIKRSTKIRGKAQAIMDYQIVLDVPRKHLYEALKAVSLTCQFFQCKLLFPLAPFVYRNRLIRPGGDTNSDDFRLAFVILTFEKDSVMESSLKRSCPQMSAILFKQR